MNNLFTKTASRFRIVLIVALFAAVVVIAYMVIFGVKQLNTFADSVNQEVVAASESEARLSSIRLAVQKLDSSQDAVKRAKQIVAESQAYRYQDMIIADIEQFAKRAGVKVLSYDFTAADNNDAGGATTEPEKSPMPAGGLAGPEAPAIPPKSQLRSTVVNISIESPVNYRNYLNFLNYIEQNLTKMQVASVSLSSGENSSQVSTESLQIEVYIR